MILNKFLTVKKIAGLSDRTLKYYHDTLSNFLEFVNKPIADVTIDDVRRYFAMRQIQEGVSAQTCNNERRNLSTFYTWMSNEGIVKKNFIISQFPQIKTPKKENAGIHTNGNRDDESVH